KAFQRGALVVSDVVAEQHAHGVRRAFPDGAEDSADGQRPEGGPPRYEERVRAASGDRLRGSTPGSRGEIVKERPSRRGRKPRIEGEATRVEPAGGGARKRQVVEVRDL